MGLFDWAKKKSVPPSPPTSDVPLPGPGVIATYVAIDGIGTIELEGGVTVRFGRSACRAFEPVIGCKVIVREIGAHPLGGFRATMVELADASYDAKIAVRDAELGRAREALTADQAAAIGWITILLDEAIPEGPVARGAWADRLGLAEHGITVGTGPSLELVCEGRTVTAYAGDTPFDAKGLVHDHRFAIGRAWVTLSLGLVEIEQQTRAMLGPTYPHPFGPAGSIRILSKLAAALVAHGTGVVLNRAGMQAVDRETFVARLGALDDPSCVPVAAWTEILVDTAAKRYVSLGMSVFALPDVSVAFDPESSWSTARGFEAVSRVTSMMVRANRAFEVGARIDVPLRARTGAYEPDVTGSCITYAVSADDRGVRLDRVMPAIDDASTWMAVSPRPVPSNVYRAVLEDAYRGRFRGELAHEVTGGGGDVPEHLVVTYALEGGGVVVATNGLGRVVQPGGVDDGIPHLEMISLMPSFSQRATYLVGGVASSAFERGPNASAYKPFDRIAAPVPEWGIGGFLIDDAGTLELARDHRVDLLVLVPVSEAEYAAAKAEGTDVWLQRVLGEPRGRPPQIMARWKRATS